MNAETDTRSIPSTSKASCKLRDEFALIGLSVFRTDSVDGAVTCYARHKGQQRHLLTLEAEKYHLGANGGTP